MVFTCINVNFIMLNVNLRLYLMTSVLGNIPYIVYFIFFLVPTNKKKFLNNLLRLGHIILNLFFFVLQAFLLLLLIRSKAS